MCTATARMRFACSCPTTRASSISTISRGVGRARRSPGRNRRRADPPPPPDPDPPPVAGTPNEGVASRASSDVEETEVGRIPWGGEAEARRLGFETRRRLASSSRNPDDEIRRSDSTLGPRTSEDPRARVGSAGRLRTSLHVAHQYVGTPASPASTSFGRRPCAHVGMSGDRHVGQSPPRDAPTTTVIGRGFTGGGSRGSVANPRRATRPRSKSSELDASSGETIPRTRVPREYTSARRATRRRVTADARRMTLDEGRTVGVIRRARTRRRRAVDARASWYARAASEEARRGAALFAVLARARRRGYFESRYHRLMIRAHLRNSQTPCFASNARPGDTSHRCDTW